MVIKKRELPNIYRNNNVKSKVNTFFVKISTGGK